MQDASNLGSAIALLRDFAGGCLLRMRKLARFIIWQWRAKKKRSTIRSFDVALSARLGHRVIIEKGVFIDAGSSIDNFSYINPNSSVENAAIGKFCSIARDVMIGPASHNYRNLSTHPFWFQEFYGFDCSGVADSNSNVRSTRILDDVWIGCNVVVMPGVTLATGAVIGAGSIVTKDVGPYEIWAGVPAKKIGQRFESDVIEALVGLDWCSLNVQEIEAMVIPNMTDVRAAIERIR